MTMSTLERAIEIAAHHHAGQVDKGGQPYILHVLRVVCAVKSPKAQIAAALHDLLEDTSMTASDLASEGFDQEVIEAVVALTKQKNESRITAAKRARANTIAREVKVADNVDNMDLTRLPDIDEKDLHRIREYALVRRILLSPPSQN